MIKRIISKLYLRNKYCRIAIKFFLKKINSNYKRTIPDESINCEFKNIEPNIFNKVLFIDFYFSCKEIYSILDKDKYDVINLKEYRQPLRNEDLFKKILQYKYIVLSEEIFELIKYKNNHNIICVWHGESILLKKACSFFIKNYIAPFNKVIVGNNNIALSKRMFSLDEKNIYNLGSIQLEKLWKNNNFLPREELYLKYDIPKNVKKIYYIAFSFEEEPIFTTNIFYSFYDIEKHMNDDEIIIYNIHPNIIKDKPNVNYYNSKKIRYIKELNRYELIPHISLFVTDYSSCISEAILLNKPSIVLIENYYTYDRGFIYKKKDFPLNLLITSNPKKIINKFREISNTPPKYENIYKELNFENATDNIKKFILQLLKNNV